MLGKGVAEREGGRVKFRWGGGNKEWGGGGGVGSREWGGGEGEWRVGCGESEGGKRREVR